ncbi:hypothetical protein D3C87_395040 [compost metagenome]
MIHNISFKNYKIFKDKQSISLRPLTILIGKNNSGKSAIAKLPTLLEGAFNSEIPDALVLENEGLELGSELKDLVYGKSIRVLEFELSNNDSNENLAIGVLISQEKSKQSAKIVHYKLNNEINLEDTGDSDIYVDRITGQEFKCNFSGFNLKECTSKDSGNNKLLNKNSLNIKTDFIGPIRINPLRDYRRLATFKTDKFGIAGENAYYYLIEDALTTDKKLLNEISQWYKENFEGWELKINQDKAPLFQIEIHRQDLKQNILDTGIGMSQVLPIVTRALKTCEEETLIIIEEPETHLHPAAHGNLATLLANSLKQGKKNYLIETHSLNFVLRLRRMIAEGTFKKEDLAIYYVDFSEENNFSLINEINVDQFGRVDYWPDGVFNETLDETVGIRSAQLDNPNYGN